MLGPCDGPVAGPSAFRCLGVRFGHGLPQRPVLSQPAKYGGLAVGEAKPRGELEDENRKRKHMVADQSLDNQALKSALGNKW